MTIDLLLIWPRHLDYPEWRKWLKEHRVKFAKIIVIFTNMSYNLPDLRNSVKAQMEKDNVIFDDNNPVSGNEDWRNVATNKALKYSNSEWVFFTEQDFHPKEGFWEYMDKMLTQNKTFGAVVGTRLHPCCIFVPRKVLNQTSKNFSVIKDVADHFSILQQELPEFEAIPDYLYSHEGGLSQKMTQELLKSQ